MVVGEAEMMTGIEPAVVGMAQRIEGSDVDHAMNMVPLFRTFQVSRM
jgi:hypothetical protein